MDFLNFLSSTIHQHPPGVLKISFIKFVFSGVVQGPVKLLIFIKRKISSEDLIMLCNKGSIFLNLFFVSECAGAFLTYCDKSFNESAYKML